MMTHSLSSFLEKSSRWHLCIILLVALMLRLMYAGWAQGNALGLGNQNDSIEAYEVAAHFEAGDERAQYLGQPNCNLHSKLPGPLWTLVCVAGLKLGGSVSGILLLNVLTNIGAIALTWKLARDLFDASAASFAALLMAISPWAVYYAAIIYNPSPMPLFGAVIFLALFRCLRRKRSRAIFWIPFLLLVGAQFHLSILSLILPVVAFACLARLKPNWPWLATAVLIALLCYSPYFLGEMRHDWANTRGILLGGTGKFSAGVLKVVTSPFAFLVNYWSPNWTYAPGQYETLARRTFGGLAGLILVNLVSAGIAVCIVTAIGRALRNALRGFRAAPREIFCRSQGLLSAAFLLLAYLAFSLIAGFSFLARYCLIVLPLIFALAGLGTTKCLNSPRLKKAFLPALLLTIAADLWFTPAMCRFERDRIANGAVFVAGFARMESIYRELKSRFPGKIEVDDHHYLELYPEGGKNNIYRHAGLLRRYVACRELEAQAAGQVFTQTNVFELRSAGLVSPDDPAVVFYRNGIALVALR